MAQRLRLFDCLNSTLPKDLGFCVGDVLRVSQAVNASQRRLLYAKEAGDDGWHGTFAEIAFNVSLPPTTAAPTLPGPYWTAPREVARLEAVDLCQFPIRLNNQQVEYLEFGNGRMPKQFFTCHQNLIREAYTRNFVPTFVDLSNAPQKLVLFLTDPADTNKRVLLQGLDQNGNVIYSQDGLNQVNGIFVPLTQPFSVAPLMFSQITGVQKDMTNGNIQLFQMDPNTGAQILLLTMQPSETTAWYRRYFFNNLPPSCCFNATPPINTPQVTPVTLSVTAIVKLDLIPVQVSTDYLLFQNLEAIRHECISLRYSPIDTPSAKQFAEYHHNQAVRLLNGELVHFLGRDNPAIEWSPFGAARLERQKIGSML